MVTLGIIYGDIGTSPLYVFKAIVGDAPITRELILGGISCIFWTLTLQTTLKYIGLSLRADNNGEGGIFSLYALVKRKQRILWIPAIIPAIIGGATLLADGIITPPISVASAIEGLRIFNEEIRTIPIVLGIITLLFVVQQFGTKTIGRTFGPMMLIWFGMLAVLGSIQLFQDWSVLAALNPYYAINLLINYPGGFWLLGAVFLCTTGAEALYSDLGHCGKENIRVSWIFVKITLVLNYLGQGAWLLAHEGKTLTGQNPFFAIMPDWFLIIGIIIATSAAIIASQALITGSFTLINEAMKLDLWPKMMVYFPTEFRGQMYNPSLNWLLWAGCVFVVLYFGDSTRMEAAYGLAITLTMLMTTILLAKWLVFKRWPVWIVVILLSIYFTIEGSFLFANLLKFHHGGYVSIIIAGVIGIVMLIWQQSRNIKNQLNEYVPILPYLDNFKQLSEDPSVSKYATHLIYLTSSRKIWEIDSKIIYSIFQKQPKRADVYWFIHVEVTEQPYTMNYRVTHLAENDLIRIDFYLGFRVPQHINVLFRTVVEDLVKNGEVDIRSRYESLKSTSISGDFRFVVLEKYFSSEYSFKLWYRLILKGYFFIKKFSLSEARGFGLDTSSVTIEKVPLTVSSRERYDLKRIYS
ncbi:MAG: potassium transporter Kup [Sphingobacteriia bacterium]|nr:potassium transporter Kup [Sphingobacteriia bacterium]